MRYAYYDHNHGCICIVNLEPDFTDWFEVDEDTDANAIYIKDGGLRYFPPKPSPFHVWDDGSEVWVDPRDPSEELAKAREASSLSRSDFVLAIVASGLVPMSTAEAGQAARGEIPAPFEPIIASLPSAIQLEAVVRWSGATMIERSNPILAALAEAMQLDNAQLDALFGIPPLSTPTNQETNL